jgi:hypothetical protein
LRRCASNVISSTFSNGIWFRSARLSEMIWLPGQSGFSSRRKQQFSTIIQNTDIIAAVDIV